MAVLKDNVILIGMPGSGKSTVGVLLAKILGYNFLDSDIVIQQEDGRKLFEIINQSGIEYFEELENRINSGLSLHKTVLATGGSVVYGKEAMEHLKSIGIVVYIKVDLPELERRITNLNTRGIVFKDGENFSDLYLKRAPLYEKYADITVTCGSESQNENAQKLADLLENM